MKHDSKMHRQKVWYDTNGRLYERHSALESSQLADLRRLSAKSVA